MAALEVWVIYEAFKDSSTIQIFGQKWKLLGIRTNEKSIKMGCDVKSKFMMREVREFSCLELQPMICKRFSGNGKILIGER